MRRIPVIALALAIVLALAPSPGRQAADGRIVAIGDVHGAFQPFAGMLTKAGLLDQQGGWAGGNTVFVQTGDLTDRGDGVRVALDLVMTLEQQAAAAGGRVETLLGNHEVMNLLGETRDVSAAAYSSFADEDSEARRQRTFRAGVCAARINQGRSRRLDDGTSAGFMNTAKRSRHADAMAAGSGPSLLSQPLRARPSCTRASLRNARPAR